MSSIVEGGIPAAQKSADAGVNHYGVFGGTRAYTGASFGNQELAGWHPRNESADKEILSNRSKMVARSRDLDRNNPWVHGGVDRRVDAVIGSKLWLRLRPNYVAMGQTAEWADGWSRQVEALFNMWANSITFDCDVERDLRFGSLIRLAYIHYVVDGEACMPLYMLDRGGMFETSVLVLDPDRLSNPKDKSDSAVLRGGCRLSPETGEAIGYWVRKSHPDDLPTDLNDSDHEYIDRFTPSGCSQFIHVFDKRRAHQRRGVPRITPAIVTARTSDSYDGIEVKAAMRNAAFGLFVRSELDTKDLVQGFQTAPTGGENSVSEIFGDYQAMRTAFHENADVTLDNVALAHLFPNEKIESVAAPNNSVHYKEFQNMMLRKMASSLGMSFEQLSNDWSQINYSSARTLLNEIWRGLHSDRHRFTHAAATPIFAAWLEEAVARDLVEIPGGKMMFYTWKNALCQCEWIGPGRGYIDPLKEIKASRERIAEGVSNLFDEAAEQGSDAEANIYEAKRVVELRKKYGLSDEGRDEPDADEKAMLAQDNDEADAAENANAGASQ